LVSTTLPRFVTILILFCLFSRCVLSYRFVYVGLRYHLPFPFHHRLPYCSPLRYAAFAVASWFTCLRAGDSAPCHYAPIKLTALHRYLPARAITATPAALSFVVRVLPFVYPPVYSARVPFLPFPFLAVDRLLPFVPLAPARSPRLYTAFTPPLFCCFYHVRYLWILLRCALLFACVSLPRLRPPYATLFRSGWACLLPCRSPSLTSSAAPLRRHLLFLPDFLPPQCRFLPASRLRDTLCVVTCFRLCLFFALVRYTIAVLPRSASSGFLPRTYLPRHGYCRYHAPLYAHHSSAPARCFAYRAIRSYHLLLFRFTVRSALLSSYHRTLAREFLRFRLPVTLRSTYLSLRYTEAYLPFMVPGYLLRSASVLPDLPAVRSVLVYSWIGYLILRHLSGLPACSLFSFC